MREPVVYPLPVECWGASDGKPVGRRKRRKRSMLSCLGCKKPTEHRVVTFIQGQPVHQPVCIECVVERKRAERIQAEREAK